MASFKGRTNLTPDEIEEIAEAAARKALLNFFLMLDVKMDDHEQVKALREDLAWSRETRQGAEKTKKWVVGTVASMVVGVLALIGYQVWEIFAQGLKVVIGGR